MTRPILTQERREEIYTLLPVQATNCTAVSAQPMYNMAQAKGMINLKNDVMRLEYDYRCRVLGLDIGMPMTQEQRQIWEMDMIEMYDTTSYVHILTAQAIGRGDFAGSDCFRRAGA